MKKVDLTSKEMKSLHREATHLYDLYLKSTAKHRVDLSSKLVQDFSAGELIKSIKL